MIYTVILFYDWLSSNFSELKSFNNYQDAKNFKNHYDNNDLSDDLEKSYTLIIVEDEEC